MEAGKVARSRWADESEVGGYWFCSIEDVKRANAESGFFFFEAGTLRFFHSRIGRTLIGGRWFVTSEEPPSGERRWTVRRAEADGSIETEGAFMAYGSGAEARRAAERIARDAGLGD